MGEQKMDGKIPLGLCKQIIMKFDSALTDIHEVIVDPDLEPLDREDFQKMAELVSTMMAVIQVIVTKEMGEEDFMSTEVLMDSIDEYPSAPAEEDMLDMPVE